jgi:hypothetical protein
LVRPTPLEPRLFFSGTWRGQGEVRFRGPLRLRRPERFTYHSSGRWISDVRREFEDRFRYESGLEVAYRLTCEVVGERRLRITSDAMPGGADILLSERGYTFTPYVLRVSVGRATVRLRCHDVNVIDEGGVIHDRIEMSWLGLPLAILTMELRVERGHLSARRRRR